MHIIKTSGKKKKAWYLRPASYRAKSSLVSKAKEKGRRKAKSLTLLT